MILVEQSATFAALLCAGIACVTDLRSRRIPNWLTFPAMLLGLALHAIGAGHGEAFRSFAALFLCGLLFLVFYLAGGMGAGDVKLIAAQGSLLSLGSVVPLLAFTAIAGGALALIAAIHRGRLRQTLSNTALLVAHHGANGLTPHAKLNVENDEAIRLPYAVAIAIGTCITVYMSKVQS